MATQSASPSSTVVVGCKYPAGLILRTFEMVEVNEPVLGGGYRKVPQARFKPRQHVVAGPAHAQNKAPKAPIHDSYALTMDVPADLWAEWVEQNKTSDLYVNGLIFAHGSERDTKAEAKEKADVKSGMERLDPKKLPAGLEAVTKK